MLFEDITDQLKNVFDDWIKIGGIFQQSLRALKHPLAKRGGRIPGSILFPITGLYMDHSYLKTPEELYGFYEIETYDLKRLSSYPATQVGGDQGHSLCSATSATQMYAYMTIHGLAG